MDQAGGASSQLTEEFIKPEVLRKETTMSLPTSFCLTLEATQMGRG